MRGAAILMLVLLSACQNEPDFDERYDAAESKIRKTANEIDLDLDARADKGSLHADKAKPAAGGGSASSE